MVKQQDYRAVSEAYNKFSRLLSDIEECKRSFEQAGEPLPQRLRDFLTSTTVNIAGNLRVIPGAKINISAPERPSRPLEATNEWVSIPARELSTTTLVMALLRKAEKPMSVKEVLNDVMRLNPDIRGGGIHNVGTRLESKGWITRREEGWSIKDRESAGILQDSYVWGPIGIFELSEVASYRREAVLALLSLSPLRIFEIVNNLKQTPWLEGFNISKDLVKGDIHALETSKKVRQDAQSKKWSLRD
jgi:hypothetical protein